MTYGRAEDPESVVISFNSAAVGTPEDEHGSNVSFVLVSIRRIGMLAGTEWNRGLPENLKMSTKTANRERIASGGRAKLGKNLQQYCSSRIMPGDVALKAFESPSTWTGDMRCTRLSLESQP